MNDDITEKMNELARKLAASSMFEKSIFMELDILDKLISMTSDKPFNALKASAIVLMGQHIEFYLKRILTCISLQETKLWKGNNIFSKDYSGLTFGKLKEQILLYKEIFIFLENPFEDNLKHLVSLRNRYAHNLLDTPIQLDEKHQVDLAKFSEFILNDYYKARKCYLYLVKIVEKVDFNEIRKYSKLKS